MVMSWSQVISVLLAAPIVTPCGGALYGGSVRPYHSVGADQERGFDGDGGAITYSTAGFGSRAAEFGSAVADADGKGGAEALRRFASTRAMKTGTTIAGVIFEVGGRVRVHVPDTDMRVSYLLYRYHVERDTAYYCCSIRVSR